MAEERVVKAGARQGAWVEIVEGVTVGDRLAVSNLPQLFDGAPVTVAEGLTGKTPPAR
jgi:multidrug efflux pump subunit AcrA (membrane-fusion protein)